MDDKPDTRQKALALNLEAKTYGTFAEIGAGQEVARWFFAVGGAAGTLAKSVSAYDKAVSDGLYGHAPRYVARERLEAMLEQEYVQLSSQLSGSLAGSKCFFAFANSVATRSFGKAGNGRGWFGIRFQPRPGDQPSQIILHAHLLDSSAAREQEAAGVLGVNLIHGAFFRYQDPTLLIDSLMDDLSRERVEIDMIKFSGAALGSLDNRLMSLELVERGFTDAAMFTVDGTVVQPSEVLYKKPILVERGSFRPATKLTADLLERAKAQFLEEPGVKGREPVVLAEMTLRNLVPVTDAGHADFLDRAEILHALGLNVLISRFEQHYQMADYLAAYTDALIGIAAGLPTVRQQVADERYYADLPGGVLESVGRLFKRSVKMYVYPTRDPVTGRIQTLDDVTGQSPWHHLQKLLREIGRLEPIREFDESLLSIRTPEVLSKIQSGDRSWETNVPPAVAAMIKEKGLFQQRPAAL
jgi:hypothetical protein